MDDSPAPNASSRRKRNVRLPKQRLAAREAEARRASMRMAVPRGPEPTRYGDWERKGIATDF